MIFLDIDHREQRLLGQHTKFVTKTGVSSTKMTINIANNLLVPLFLNINPAEKLWHWRVLQRIMKNVSQLLICKQMDGLSYCTILWWINLWNFKALTQISISFSVQYIDNCYYTNNWSSRTTSWCLRNDSAMGSNDNVISYRGIAMVINTSSMVKS